jgi:hypothetical protein
MTGERAMRRLEKLIFYPYPLRVVLAQKLKNRLRSFSREHYHIVMLRAAVEGAQLGFDRISVVEFGVAGGKGLLEIEAICSYLERRFPVTFDVYGFDTGRGLPPPQDWRDRPWQWSEGWYDMDIGALQKRLKRAELVIGDVAETVPKFLQDPMTSPVGAAMFDLDYYSSTKAALALFENPDHTKTLPRVLCYFDDIGSIEDVGAMRAVLEFNSDNGTRKIKPYLSRPTLTLDYDVRWKIFDYHDFQHPLYDKLIHRENRI